MDNNVIGHGPRWVIMRKTGQKSKALFTADPNVDYPWQVDGWQLNEGYETEERSPQVQLTKPGTSNGGSVTSSSASIYSDASNSDTESLPGRLAPQASVTTPVSPEPETAVAPPRAKGIF